MEIVKDGINQIKDQYDVSDVALCIHAKGNVYTNHINKYIDLEVRLNKNKAFIVDFSATAPFSVSV